MSISSLTALLLASAPATADLPPLPPPPVEEAVVAVPEESAVETAPPTAEPTEGEVNEIVVSGSTEAPPGDPLVQLNAQSYEVTQAVDDAFVAPVAKGYEDVVPKPVRSGLRNFFRNLKSPIIFLNYMLQLKPGKAMETLGRFAINSTIGIAGLVDVAKDDPFNLPFRDNGFANTLGYYGVGTGPFFFLPLIGPTTLRDVVGGAIDGLVLPTAIGKPFNMPEYTITTGIIRSLDYRIQFDEELMRQRATEDPYTASREFYLQRRKAEIEALHGRKPIVIDTSAFTAPAPVAEPVTVATQLPSPVEEVAPAPMPAPAPQFVSEPVVQPLPQ